jgi:hypothetical protein
MIGKITVILIIFISIASAFQCNSSETKKSGELKKKTSYENPFFPLADGNYWSYINVAPGKETDQFTVKAMDSKKVEGGMQLKVSSFPYLTKENTEQSLLVKSNGEIEAVNYFNSTGIFTPSPENFKKGYEWQFGIFRGYINSENDTVKTSAGTFSNCFYIMITEGFTFSFEMWYKKDVGIVKWGANRTNPPSLITYYILKEYKVN